MCLSSRNNSNCSIRFIQVEPPCVTVFKKLFVIVSLNSNVLVLCIVINLFPTLIVILFTEIRRKPIANFYDWFFD